MLIDKSKIVWWIAIPLIIILLYFIFRSSCVGESSVRGEKSSKGFSAFFPLGSPDKSSAKSIFSGAGQMSYVQIIEGLKSGDINLVWEIWAARETCAEGTPPESCDQKILEMILANYPQGEAERLKELISKYFRYEEAIRKLDLPENIKFDEKYAKIKAKRREMLSEEMAKLIFGPEEAQIDFLDEANAFKEKSQNMKGDDRVTAYEELKKKTYGPYYRAMKSREDKYDSYQTELDLREGDFSKQNSTQKSQTIREMREKYFGKAAADQMEKAEIDEIAQQQRIQNYESEAQRLKNENKNLNEQELADKLKALREKVLGQEEAEAYERRKAVEAATK